MRIPRGRIFKMVGMAIGKTKELKSSFRRLCKGRRTRNKAKGEWVHVQRASKALVKALSLTLVKRKP